MYTPFTIGRRFRIIPPGAPAPTDDRLDIIMARGAFGSGEHETSASCLELLETLPDLPGARVLDLGSGTGILTLAALRLGAREALCVDIDPAAVAACRLACEQNGVEERVRHCCGTLEEVREGSFDLVLGNIYGDILLAVAPQLVAAARPGGRLLLSGILWQDNFDVRRRYEQLGCTVQKNRMLDEFSTVLLKKTA